MMATTVNDDSLKRSLAVSAVLHTCLFLFLYFGLPVLFTPPPEHHVPVPLEIVEIADITNTRTKEPEPQQKPPEPPPPKPEPPKPVTPPPQALPQPKPPEPQEAITPIPKPLPKPTPPAPQKPKTDDFAKLLKNLETTKKTETPKTEQKTEQKQTSQTQEATSQAPVLSTRLTISEEDLLRRQVEQCWNMPIGARDAQSLIVEINIDMNPDRTVQHAEVVDKSRMATDSFYRAAAEAALRALYNPRCSPLELPEGKYEQWKHIDFTFDPRDML